VSLVAFAADSARPSEVVAQSSRTAAPSALDIDKVRGLLAVQRLDGWLLTGEGGNNPIALELVGVPRRSQRRWFYYVPAKGQPTAIAHKAEAALFARIPGRKVEYAGWRELDAALAETLRGAKRVAMEYSDKASMRGLSYVDGGTVERVKKNGVEVVSSAELVQYTKSVWGPDGRVAHYVAAHHLTKILDEAFRFVVGRTRAKRRVTEYDVQQFILRSMKVRGLTAEAPVVAVNGNASDPAYRPGRRGSAAIAEGDLLVIDMWGKLAGKPDAVYAELSWTAYVGTAIPERYQRAFAAVAKARDAGLEYARGKLVRRRPVRGFEVDQRVRRVVNEAGFGDKFIHRSGHSIDTDRFGAGANLDDYETHDIRTLVRGSGFTVGPGVYVKGDFGVRTEVSVFVGIRDIEVTTPLQEAITPLFAGAFDRR